MIRDDRRLQKLTGSKVLGTKGQSKESIEAELEFYWFKGGKTKSVRNRIDRLTDALDILVERELEKLELEKLKLEKLEC